MLCGETLTCSVSEAGTFGCACELSNCPAPICAQPQDVGPCDGVCPRWWHNPETGDCELFSWGCCDGNDNNFETQEDCEAACP